MKLGQSVATEWKKRRRKMRVQIQNEHQRKGFAIRCENPMTLFRRKKKYDCIQWKYMVITVFPRFILNARSSSFHSLGLTFVCCHYMVRYSLLLLCIKCCFPFGATLSFFLPSMKEREREENWRNRLCVFLKKVVKKQRRSNPILHFFSSLI